MPHLNGRHAVMKILISMLALFCTSCATSSFHWDRNAMKSMLRILITLFSLGAMASASESNATVVAQITIRSNGNVLYDGTAVELRELHLLLSNRQKRGEVWIYCARLSKTIPVAREVIDVVTSYGHSIRILRLDPLAPFSPSAASRSPKRA